MISGNHFCYVVMAGFATVHLLLPHLCVPLQCRILVHSYPYSFQSLLVFDSPAELTPAPTPHAKPAQVDLVLNIMYVITQGLSGAAAELTKLVVKLAVQNCP